MQRIKSEATRTSGYDQVLNEKVPGVIKIFTQLLINYHLLSQYNHHRYGKTDRNNTKQKTERNQS